MSSIQFCPNFLNWLFLLCLGISPEYHAHTHAHTHAHSHTHLHLHPSQQAQAQQEAAAAAAGFPLPGKQLLENTFHQRFINLACFRGLAFVKRKLFNLIFCLSISSAWLSKTESIAAQRHGIGPSSPR